jgi:anti-sigma factor RsiW
MRHSDEHAEIRNQLALLVAGVLDADTEARIASHTVTCPACAAELERWQIISGALRRLPTPQPSAEMFERTRAAVAAQLAARAEKRENRLALILLIFFSWVVTLVGWPVFRVVSSGLISVLDIRFRQLWLLFAIFSALAWLAGGSAAVLLSVRRRQERRLA